LTAERGTADPPKFERLGTTYNFHPRPKTLDQSVKSGNPDLKRQVIWKMSDQIRLTLALAETAWVTSL
jgi:hypothetical protein